MAKSNSLNGTQLYIKVGDGAAPEVFTHPCLINSDRGITFKASTNDVVVPDCTNPDDPAWREIVKDVLSVSISGAGVLDATQMVIDAYSDWFRSAVAKNVQVWLGTLGYWSGKFHLTEWDIKGERKDKIQSSLSLESDGPISDFTPGV